MLTLRNLSMFQSNLLKSEAKKFVNTIYSWNKFQPGYTNTLITGLGLACLLMR